MLLVAPVVKFCGTAIPKRKAWLVWLIITVIECCLFAAVANAALTVLWTPGDVNATGFIVADVYGNIYGTTTNGAGSLNWASFNITNQVPFGTPLVVFATNSVFGTMSGSSPITYNAALAAPTKTLTHP